LDPRLVSRNVHCGIRTRRVYLESLDVKAHFQSQGTFPIRPRPGTLIRVCRRFFKWVFAISNNKLDQPTMVEDDEFSVRMHGPRVRSWYDLGACEFIIKWMLDYSEGHLHDPSSDSHFICFDKISGV